MNIFLLINGEGCQGEEWINLYNFEWGVISAYLIPASEVQHTHENRPSMSLSHDGRQCAMALKDGRLAVWDIAKINAFRNINDTQAIINYARELGLMKK